MTGVKFMYDLCQFLFGEILVHLPLILPIDPLKDRSQVIRRNEVIMNSNKLVRYLQGGDLRSIAAVEKLLPLIKNQEDFDTLFHYLSSEDRLLAMRAAEAVEKITLQNPAFLHSHKNAILKLMEEADDKELKWHLALLISRLELSTEEISRAWGSLTKWAKSPSESKIVRVNSIDSLYKLSTQHQLLKQELEGIIQELEAENIPSLNARIRKLRRVGYNKG